MFFLYIVYQFAVDVNHNNTIMLQLLFIFDLVSHSSVMLTTAYPLFFMCMMLADCIHCIVLVSCDIVFVFFFL